MTPEKFISKLLLVDECLEWQGSKSPKGYGKFKIGRKNTYAHRYAYSAFKGPLEPGKQVMHTCDNPSCCNPEHLRQGTNQDNVDDKMNKGRHYQQTKTHCSNGHEFTEDNIYVRPSRPTHRQCRQCRRDEKKK